MRSRWAAGATLKGVSAGRQFCGVGLAHVLVEAIRQIKEIALQEAMAWPFAAMFAAAAGYGRIEIIVDKHKISRVNVQTGCQDERPPDKMK